MSLTVVPLYHNAGIHLFFIDNASGGGDASSVVDNGYTCDL